MKSLILGNEKKLESVQPFPTLLHHIYRNV